MRIIFYLFGAAICSGSAVCAQSIGPSDLNSAGGSATIGAGTFEYAIGGAMSGVTFSSGTLIVTPGVLQPVFPTGIRSPAGLNGGLSVYPSPVSATLYLQPAMHTPGTLKYALYDAAGKLVISESKALLQGNERQEADVRALAAGQYTLQVEWLAGSTIQYEAFKIQKLQ